MVGDVHALLLGSHAGEGHQHFHVHFVAVDALFLEVDAHAQLFQGAQDNQQFLGVPRKPGYRFCNNPVNLTQFTVTDEPVLLIALFHVCAAQALVSIHVHQLVLRVFALIIFVVADLCRKRV